MDEPATQDVVELRALPGPQTYALEYLGLDMLYGGARGGGKSIFLALSWLHHAARCWKKNQKAARGLLLRRTRKQLTDLLAKMTPVMARTGWVFTVGEWTWTNPTTGAVLTMAYLERDADAENYQGWDISWLGIDEAGNFPDPAPIDKLYATLRLPDCEHMIRFTANPGGPGHQWLKERYVDQSRPFTPFRAKDQEGHELPFYRVYIPARLKDNPSCNTEEYRAFLRASGPAWLVEAWLEGNWNVTPGGGVIDPDKIIDAKPPSGIERRLLGGDLAFTEDEWNDACAFAEIGKWTPSKELPPQFHILFVDSQHLDIPGALKRMLEIQKVRNLKWVRCEGGPSGRAIKPMIMDRMRVDGLLFDFQLTSHMLDKIAKNTALASAVGMGLVYADKSASWWPQTRTELMSFDGKDGRPDNIVDALGVAFREIDLLPNNIPGLAAKEPPKERTMEWFKEIRDNIPKAANKNGNHGPIPMWRR
jgi:phage terminase large subunit-like protein